ncbi:MAG TPA: dethiobiotin synthase [Gallionellaceae bacterium]
MLRRPGMSYFVTGTDTGVGKTLVSCALLHALAAQGRRVAGFKPVAAGCEADGRNEDAVALLAASSMTLSYRQVNPYCFQPAIAPHIAAAQAGERIEIAHILAAYRELAAKADVVVVEGAGGFRVPLNEEQDSADLARELNLPVILVVGVRLGCLNHALLTAEAIAARGLVLVGWVANVLDAQMHALQDNVAALRERMDAPLLGTVPRMAQPDARQAARQLDLCLLRNEQENRAEG